MRDTVLVVSDKTDQSRFIVCLRLDMDKGFIEDSYLSLS
jgi:hypothetical protein